MADHNIDILIRARDQASKAIGNVNRSLGKLSTTARQGVGTAVRNIAKLGAVAAGVGAGIGVLAIKSGIESLATLESATTSVTGAIEQMGLKGQVTANQVAGWANEIEASVGAAFDDKDITASTATLIRYGRLAPKNLRPAMVVMTDLAAKTGSVESASSLLAKALADPTKAAGKLARAGVILSKEDQKRLAQLVKANRLGDAQALVLDRVAKSTKGAAAASQGPYAKAMATLGDATEDAERALAVGFLPVIQKAADWLKTKLADPNTQKRLEEFGHGLAGAFDKALDFAQKIPWGAIGSGLQTAADWAGKLFDAFNSMPTEVKGTIIALAGLNKLSGGAIGSIVSTLGSGLIKGVLGMTAGVVNINAGVVKGGGGAGDLIPGAGAAAGAIGLGGVVAVALTAASVAALGIAFYSAMQQKPDYGPGVNANKTHPGFSYGHGFGPPGARQRSDSTTLGAVKDATDHAAQSNAQKLEQAKAAQVDAIRTSGSTTGVAIGGTTSAVNSAQSAIVGAINSIPAPVVNVNVSPTTINQYNTTQQRAGAVGGSRGGSGPRGKTNDRGKGG